ncbi:MAG: hypothetical protein ACP5G6_06465 [Conexivisphaera sp.]
MNRDKAGGAGEYRYQMYGGTRRKFVKVVIMVDVRTRRLLSVEASVQGRGPQSQRWPRPRSGGCTRRGRG